MIRSDTLVPGYVVDHPRVNNEQRSRESEFEYLDWQSGTIHIIEVGEWMSVREANCKCACNRMFLTRPLTQKAAAMTTA